MSDADKDVQVNDRRRFDPEGNVRPEAAQQAQQAQPDPSKTTQASPGAGATPGGPDAQGSDELETAPAGSLPPPEVMAAELERMTGELASARKRVDELARAYQALMQDRDDFKARLTRERERMIDVEKGNAAKALLEGIDELDRALAATPDDASPLAQGVRLVRENLLAKAQQTGIERLNLVGQPFDPNVAEAVDMELTTDPEADQTVVQELAAGYRLKDKVVRPARVKVARYVKPATA